VFNILKYGTPIHSTGLLASRLEAAKNAAELIEEEPSLESEVASGNVDFNRIIGIVLTKETMKMNSSKRILGLKRNSSTRRTPICGFFPIIVYDSTLEDLDDIYEKSISEIYDDLFSDEFKPLAYDIAYPKVANRELARVLRLYYSK
jgi:hypothetical protein